MKCLGGDLMGHFMNHFVDGMAVEAWYPWVEVEVVMDYVFQAILPVHKPCTGQHRLWAWASLAPCRSFT